MCEKYFERNSNELFNVRHNDLSFIFCSKICASHFILKHRVMNICACCGQEKFNFDMIQEYDGHGKNRMVCSMKCLGYNNEPMLVVNDEEIALNATPSHADRMVSCQPVMETRATQSTSIESRNARTQTGAWSTSGVIPIPVPIYMPQPCLLAQPYPKPVPFVLPIVVPIFVALNNLVGRLTGKKKQNLVDEPSNSNRISEISNPIESASLGSSNLAIAASELLDPTSEYESVFDERADFERRFVTSTPIGSVAGDFTCNIQLGPLKTNSSMNETRHLKPDVTLENLKQEEESSDGSFFSQHIEILGNRKSIKRSFSDVDSEDMQGTMSLWKKPRDANSFGTISKGAKI